MKKVLIIFMSAAMFIACAEGEGNKEVKEEAQEATEEVTDEAEDMMEAVSDEASDAGDSMEEAGEEVVDAAEEGAEKSGRSCRRNDGRKKNNIFFTDLI